MSLDTNTHTINTVTHTVTHNAEEILEQNSSNSQSFNTSAMIPPGTGQVIADSFLVRPGKDAEVTWEISQMGLTARKVSSGSHPDEIIFHVDNNGRLRASQKSFAIPNPVRPGEMLVYGCVEAPQQAISVFGSVSIERTKGEQYVSLPSEWPFLLVEPLGYYVALTPCVARRRKCHVDTPGAYIAFPTQTPCFPRVVVNQKYHSGFCVAVHPDDFPTDGEPIVVDYHVSGYRKTFEHESE